VGHENIADSALAGISNVQLHVLTHLVSSLGVTAHVIGHARRGGRWQVNPFQTRGPRSRTWKGDAACSIILVIRGYVPPLHASPREVGTLIKELPETA